MMVSTAQVAWRTKPRASTSRSRTGCKTCRIRRIKCDEAKPVCAKCLTTGRKCDYHQTQSASIWGPIIPRSNRTMIDSPPFIASGSTVRLTFTPILAPSIFDPSTSQEEMRAFEFLHHLGTSQLPGYFSSDLWSGHLLCLSRESQAVFCAATALSSLHEWYAAGMSPNLARVERFAFQQYNKAIKHLVDSKNPPSEVVILASCYIFSNFEALYGNYIAAFNHISNGIHLLLQQMTKSNEMGPSTQLRGFKDTMMLHFSRLDIVTGLAAPSWKPLTTGLMANLYSIGKPFFSSINEAREGLDSIIIRILAFRGKVSVSTGVSQSVFSPEMEHEQRRLHNEIITWQRVINALFQNTECGFEIRHQINLLLINSIGMLMMLLVDSNAEESEWDQFIDHFRSIVGLASDLHSLPSRSPALKRSYSVEMGIIPVLYLTGLKCRDPTTRREAQGLLASSNRKEWMWESLVAAKVVERVICIEEEGLVVETQEDIPVGARLHHTWVQLQAGPNRSCSIALSRPTNGHHNPYDVIEEVISW